MSNNNRYAIIMAGGIGSRFWPASTEENPKQFMDILGTGRTMIQMTYDRLKSTFNDENIWVLTNNRYIDLVEQSLPAIPKTNILGEPSRNNTAPAIAYAVWKIGQKNPNAVFFISAADHLITREIAFAEALNIGLNFVFSNDAILTLGIQPTRPDTGYGYIEMGDTINHEICCVNSFREKPVLSKALEYLESKNYVWNSGNFFFSFNTIREEFILRSPNIACIMDKIRWEQTEEANDIAEQYPLCPDISIDFAVMEKSEKIYCLPVDLGWSDLGTWKSLYEVARGDKENVTIGSDNITLSDSTGCLVYAESNTNILGLGIENLIVVQDKNNILILDMRKEQEVKELLKMHKDQKSSKPSV